MVQSYKSFGIWLLVSLVAGAALGAYLAVRWKERQTDKRVAAAVQVEIDRQKPLRDEVEALRLALDRQRLLVEVAAIAGQVEARNFGLVRERLVRMGEDLQALADRSPLADGETLRTIAGRLEEVEADLEALDPEAAQKLHRVFADLRETIGQS